MKMNKIKIKHKVMVLKWSLQEHVLNLFFNSLKEYVIFKFLHLLEM